MSSDAPGPSAPAPQGPPAPGSMVEASEDADQHAPVFMPDDQGEVVADLDEEDDAPMSDSDDDELDPAAADVEDRDAETGEAVVPPSDDAIATAASHRAPVYATHWSPAAGDLFATGGGDDVAFLHRLNLEDNTLTTSAPLTGHADSVSDVRFNRDGTLLATAGLDGRALIWRASDGARTAALEGPGGGLEWVRWHPKGDVLLAGSEDFTAWMWNASDGALMQVFAGHSGSVSCGGFAPDGKSVATGSADGSLRVWAPRTGECVQLFQGHPYHDGPVTCLDFHPSTPGLILTGSEDNTARLVSASSGRVLGSLSAHVETVETVGLSGDFNFGASGAIDGKLVVWDLNTLAQRSVAQHDKAVSMLQWIPGTACLYRCEKQFFVRLGLFFFSRKFFFSNRYATKGPRPADGAGAAVDTSLRDPNARHSYGASRLGRSRMNNLSRATVRRKKT